ncbi:CLUMA_CG019962, isoform A [Clunio marinus]|uniref:CLUMA_CG019962, isoform A n=1 Tax=Clunio marinus TaxID=568069 RepID=A0A1J1J3L4_9DIPT|nr:CLUMA_CG019962, isoform A [Clunio marinus]
MELEIVSCELRIKNGEWKIKRQQIINKISIESMKHMHVEHSYLDIKEFSLCRTFPTYLNRQIKTFQMKWFNGFLSNISSFFLFLLLSLKDVCSSHFTPPNHRAEWTEIADKYSSEFIGGIMKYIKDYVIRFEVCESLDLAFKV